MPCKHYKDALIEVAASGAAAHAELLAHLAECASCRAAFDEEQSLFATIDSGLHAAANAEVPTSLIPRIRAWLDEVAVAHPRWSAGWSALVAAATVAVVLLLTMRVHHDNFDGLSARSAANLPVAPETVPTQTPSIPSPRETGRLPRSPLVSAAKSAKPMKEGSHALSPEILVPRDQEALLASYAQQWSSRPRAPLVASDVVDAKLEPLKVPPIQITNLDVKPLAEEGSQ